MHKSFYGLPLLCCLLLCACAPQADYAQKDAIFALVENHQDLLLSGIESGNFDGCAELDGILEITAYDDHVDFYCTEESEGSSASYYGFYYAPEDNMTAIWCVEDDAELTAEGDGYACKQGLQGCSYYTELIFDHFYYYEAHY